MDAGSLTWKSHEEKRQSVAQSSSVRTQRKSGRRQSVASAWTLGRQSCRRCEVLVDEIAPPYKEWLALADIYHQVAAVIGWRRAVNFGYAVWELKRPPSRAETHPVHGGGAGMIYIPHSISGKSGRDLVTLAGDYDAQKLVRFFSGQTLEFPCLVKASISQRNKAIAEQVAAGSSVGAVAFCFCLTDRQVRRICELARKSVSTPVPTQI